MAIIMTDSKYYGEIAEAIREKNGTTNSYTPSQMGMAITAIENNGGGTDNNEKQAAAIIERTASVINNNQASSVGEYAFYSCISLTEIKLPMCETIGTRAFYLCTSLTSANFSICNYIDGIAFSGCSSLSFINAPLCSYIGNYTFYNTALTSANFPACTYIAPSAFGNCQNLSIAIFSTSYIGSKAFLSCSKLASLTNTYSSVATLYNRSAFYYTPMSNSTYKDINGNAIGWGSIYVPASLVDSYKTATNWASYAARITAIPE